MVAGTDAPTVRRLLDTFDVLWSYDAHSGQWLQSIVGSLGEKSENLAALRIHLESYSIHRGACLGDWDTVYCQ